MISYFFAQFDRTPDLEIWGGDDVRGRLMKGGDVVIVYENMGNAGMAWTASFL